MLCFITKGAYLHRLEGVELLPALVVAQDE